MYTASTGLLNICSSVQAVAPPKCAAKASATSRLRVHTEVSFAPVTCLSPAAKRLAESPPPITPHVTTPGIPAPIRRLFSGTFVFCSMRATTLTLILALVYLSRHVRQRAELTANVRFEEAT